MKKNCEEYNQIYVCSFLKKLQISGLDFEFWATPNGGYRDRATASKMKLMGMLAGVPDFCIMAYNLFFFIEFKKNNGHLSQAQKLFIEKSHRYGWKVYTVHADDPKQAIDAVSKIMADILPIDQNVISSISAKVLTGIEKS